MVTAFVVDETTPRAVVFAQCHGHEASPAAWLDIAVGSFSEPEFADQVTFSCRVTQEGATLFDAVVAAEGKASLFGRKLSRAEAEHHPQLSLAWEIVDFVVTAELGVAAAVYGDA